MITEELAEYISTALSKPLPDSAREAGVAHIIDTIGSMVAGTTLGAGKRVIPYVGTLGGRSESTVVGAPIKTTAINAAMANGMLAHADETDDSHAPSLTHPGCSIVPAAMACAERHSRSGADFLRAVVLGYDVGVRVSAALGGGLFLDRYLHSSHAFGGIFGACAAASALAGLQSKQVEYALGYAVQLASGIPCWVRDPDHVEKAFMFGGMPAQGGVQAASLAAAGFTASSEPLEGTPGLFFAFPDRANPLLALDGLGERYEVTRTTIKKWSTASPIQSALDSMLSLKDEFHLNPDDIASIHVTLPPRRAIAVDNRAMPAVNLQHQVALLLIDGDITFVSGHEEKRMHDPQVKSLREKIHVEASHSAPEGGQAHVAVALFDGRVLRTHTAHVRGTPFNPMTRDEVLKKAHGLMEPVLRKRSAELLDVLTHIDKVANVGEFLNRLLKCDERAG